MRQGEKKAPRDVRGALGNNMFATILYLAALAPQVGLEPTTYGLTVRRSNQLSY